MREEDEGERLARRRAREAEALDRDLRTVFVFNLSTKARERDIFEFFADGGCEVSDVRLVMDRYTKRSKGVAYVEMALREQVPAALGLAGGKLFGHEVGIRGSEAEKNAAWEAQQHGGVFLPPSTSLLPPAPGAGLGPGLPAAPRPAFPLHFGGPARLTVANVHPELTEAELRPVFEPFGGVGFVESRPAEDGRGRVVVLQYEHGIAALSALQQLNGLDLAGMKLDVAPAPFDAPPQAAQVQAAPAAAFAPPVAMAGVPFAAAPPAPVPSVTQGMAVQPPAAAPAPTAAPVQQPVAPMTGMGGDALVKQAAAQVIAELQHTNAGVDLDDEGACAATRPGPAHGRGGGAPVGSGMTTYFCCLQVSCEAVCGFST